MAEKAIEADAFGNLDLLLYLLLFDNGLKQTGELVESLMLMKRTAGMRIKHPGLMVEARRLSNWIEGKEETQGAGEGASG